MISDFPGAVFRVEKRYLKGRDGLRLAATVGGDPHGQPVLFLHGGGQTRSSWGHGAKKLAERGYYVMALDARGHGDSGWGASEDTYSLDYLIDDLKAIVATLDRPPALVGASMGGITSLVAVGESDVPIARALVMVDVTPRLSPAGTEAIFGFMNANPNGFATLDDAVESVARYLPHRPRPTDGGKGLMRNLRHGKDGRLYWHWDPAFTSSLGRFQEETQSRMLAAATKIKVPTMLIRGGNSEIVSIEAVEEFHALLPEAEIVEISGAHHMVAGDRNDAFNRTVMSFLDRHVPKS